MNQPWIYKCSPSWSPHPPPVPSQPSGSSQCTSPEHFWVISSWKQFCQSNLPLLLSGHWPFPTSQSGFPISFDSRGNISMDWSRATNLKVFGVQLQDCGVGISKASSSGRSRRGRAPEEGTAAGALRERRRASVSCSHVCVRAPPAGSGRLKLTDFCSHKSEMGALELVVKDPYLLITCILRHYQFFK